MKLIKDEWGNFENLELDFGFRNFVHVKHPKGSEGKFCGDGIQFEKGLQSDNYLEERIIKQHLLFKYGQIFLLDKDGLFVQLFHPEPCSAVILING